MKRSRREELMKIKEIYTKEELAILLSISISTINRWSEVIEPPTVFNKKRTIRYHYDDFVSWCKEMSELEEMKD